MQQAYTSVPLSVMLATRLTVELTVVSNVEQNDYVKRETLSFLPPPPVVRSLTFCESGSSHRLAQFAKEAGFMKGKLQLANGQSGKNGPQGQKKWDGERRTKTNI